MAITTFPTENYVIPRGRAYFNKLVGGSYIGDRAVGNAPSYDITLETEKAEHYHSKSGVREKDMDRTVQIDRKAQIVIDNMSLENLALFVGGELSTVTQTATPVADEAITVKEGYYYQLGATTANPPGVRGVSSVVIQDVTDTTTYVEGTDYQLDASSGRIYIIVGGGISDDDVLHVDYTPTANSRSRVATSAVATVYGGLRTVADNDQGENQDMFAPYAALTPTGSLPVITDDTEVVAMTFDVEFLVPVDTTLGASALYIDGVAA